MQPIAINPLQWFPMPGAEQQGSPLPLSGIYRQVRDLGFGAVSAEPQDDENAAAYARLLSDLDLAPAPGYFQASFEVRSERPAILDRARRVARHHATLGLDRIFIAAQFPDPDRFLAPAQGVARDSARFALLVESLEATCRVMVSEGVTPCLHQHVATLIETPEETEQVLAAIDPHLLLLGPDTGHLAWAGAGIEQMLARYSGRIGAVHLKDLHLQVADTARRTGASYNQACSDHVWTEPGRGDVDFAAALRSLEGFQGWVVVEVDIPDNLSALASAAASLAWCREHLAV